MIILQLLSSTKIALSIVYVIHVFYQKVFWPSTEIFVAFLHFQCQNLSYDFRSKIFVFLCCAHVRYWNMSKTALNDSC